MKNILTKEKIHNQENGNSDLKLGSLARNGEVTIHFIGKKQHFEKNIVIYENKSDLVFESKHEGDRLCKCDVFCNKSRENNGELKKLPIPIEKSAALCSEEFFLKYVEITLNIFVGTEVCCESVLFENLSSDCETDALTSCLNFNKDSSKSELVCLYENNCKTETWNTEKQQTEIVIETKKHRLCTSFSRTFQKEVDIEINNSIKKTDTSVQNKNIIDLIELLCYNQCNQERKITKDTTSMNYPRRLRSNPGAIPKENEYNFITCSQNKHKIKLVVDSQTDDIFIDKKDFKSLKDKPVIKEELSTDSSRCESKLPKLSKKVVKNADEIRKILKNISSCANDENQPAEKDVELALIKNVESKVSKHERSYPYREKTFRNRNSKIPDQDFVFDFNIFREWYIMPMIQRTYNVYILTIHERIETFKFWPKDAAVSKIDLVEAGFIYKGDGYEVECDTCKLAKSEWSVDDVPLIIHKILKPDCEFLKTTFPDLQVPTGRNETDNPCLTEGQQSLVNQMDSMSIGNRASQNQFSLPTTVKNDLTTYNARVQSSLIAAPQQQPLYDGATNPSTMFQQGATANDGLSIAGVPPRHPDFATIQQRIWSFRPWAYGHIQNPVYLVDAGFYYIGKEDIVRCYFCDIGLAEWDADDDPWAEHARHSPDCEYLKREKGPDFIENIQVQWRQIYCPRHPEFSDYHVRVGTYTNWPSNMDQRPNALAEAGFYYTGEDDVVRCHYCDGGLRQWEAGDVPWTEHARWFPFCKYIVKIKGLAFIEEIARRYNLLTQGQTLEPQMIPGISEGELNRNLPREVYDRILELGYTCGQVNRAFQLHVQMTGRRHASADELTNILLENDFSAAPSPINNQPSTAAKEVAMKTPSDIENLEPEKLLDMNKQLRNQLICNTCNKNESNIVFSPCGHRNTCGDCSKNLSKCKTCGSKINTKIKTFLA